MVSSPRNNIFSCGDQLRAVHIAFASCLHQPPRIYYGDAYVEQWQMYASLAIGIC